MFKKLVKRASSFILAATVAMTIFAVPATEAHAMQNSSGAIAWGIDVSKYNGGINWAAVAQSGASFAFVKVGSTKSGMDPCFVGNINGANAAGLRVGVYIYSYAANADQARAEANQVLSWIEPYQVSFPVVYDIENSIQSGLPQAQIQEMINAFCSTVAAAGYYPMVYSYKNWYVSKIGSTPYDKWVAQYNDYLDYSGAVIWQNSSHGSVSGVPTRVDTNYLYKDYSGIIISDGLVDRDGGTRFYTGYHLRRGWVDWAETRFHADEAGFIQKNMWFEDPSGIYYLQGDGSVARGMVNIEGGTYFFDPTGARRVGWQILEDGKHFFAPDTGNMVRGWFSDESGTYYFAGDNGFALTGACTVEGQNYYFNADGVRVGGWVPLETGTFFYAPDTGIMVKGWVDDEAGRHYMSTKDGHLLVGDVKIEGKNYYFGDNGVMVVGLAPKADGNTYYYDETGAQVFSTQIVIGDKTYDINKKGVVTEVIPPEPTPEETADTQAQAPAPAPAQ